MYLVLLTVVCTDQCQQTPADLDGPGWIEREMMVRWWVECEKEMVGSRWREGTGSRLVWTTPNTQIHTVL